MLTIIAIVDLMPCTYDFLSNCHRNSFVVEVRSAHPCTFGVWSGEADTEEGTSL